MFTLIVSCKYYYVISNGNLNHNACSHFPFFIIRLVLRAERYVTCPWYQRFLSGTFKSKDKLNSCLFFHCCPLSISTPCQYRSIPPQRPGSMVVDFVFVLLRDTRLSHPSWRCFSDIIFWHFLGENVLLISSLHFLHVTLATVHSSRGCSWTNVTGDTVLQNKIWQN